MLFELISARYEHRSILITANQPFGEWNRVFPDPAMTLAAVDRLVHHATIFEMNVESYRRRADLEEKRQRGRPASFATIRTSALPVAERQSENDEDLASANQHDNFIPTVTEESHPDCRQRLILIAALYRHAGLGALPQAWRADEGAGA